jgi:hypothetical protein
VCGNVTRRPALDYSKDLSSECSCSRVRRQIRLVPGTHAIPPTRSTTPHHRDVPAIPLPRIAPKTIAAPVTPAESHRRSPGRAGSNQLRKLIVLRSARQDGRLTSFDDSPLVCASVRECHPSRFTAR